MHASGVVLNRVTALTGWRKPRSRRAGLDGCSVVVATYRRPRELLALLERLAELPDPPGEVAVVDGSPNDDGDVAATEWARNAGLPFDFKYVRSPPGLTRQRNVGIDATVGDLVFFLDDDCIPEPQYFSAIQTCFREDAAGNVGAVCGFVENEVGRPLTRRWRWRLALRIVPHMQAGAYFPTATSYPYALGQRFEGTRRVDVMPGCAMSFRRSVLARHRFSVFFDGYAQGEDLEMSLRVGRELAILWCGNAHAVHHQSPAGRPSSAEKGRMEVRNRFFIWRRFSQQPPLEQKARFWLDVAFGVACDLGSAIARPTSFAPFRHAAGLLRGMVSCLTAPPHHEEPPACREYAFTFTDLYALADSPSVGSNARPRILW